MGRAVNREEARRLLDGYGSAEPALILDALDRVAELVRTEQVRTYLSGKIEKARAEGTREACLPLRPYLEWYVQGAK